MAVGTTASVGNAEKDLPVVKKGRGLSFEEKRKRLSEYLLNKVYTLLVKLVSN